jgi:hypothetical protein
MAATNSGKIQEARQVHCAALINIPYQLDSHRHNHPWPQEFNNCNSRDSNISQPAQAAALYVLITMLTTL